MIVSGSSSSSNAGLFGVSREMPRNYKLMACKQQTSFSYGGQEYPLSK